MKRYFLQHPGIRILFLFAMIAGIFLATGNDANSQNLRIPRAPILTLTGEDGGYAKDWYPDGRVWLPASGNSPREFLLPVWIDNRWLTYPETPKYQANAITSFTFGIIYDSSALRAVGVQKFGPRDEDNGYEPLAKNFNISWHDVKDMSYKEFFYDNPNPNLPSFQERDKGRLIRIVGTSTTDSLPNTDPDGQEFKVLLYVRFQVVPNINQQAEAINTPIYIKGDVIKYNDWNIRVEPPFQRLRRIDPTVATDYPNEPNKFSGMAGMNNLDLQLTEFYLPGTITIRITNKIPRIGLDVNRGIGWPEPLKTIRPDLIEMVDPITVDSASSFPEIGSRIVKVMNTESGTRLLDLKVESDQPWLEFRTLVRDPNSEKGPIRNPTRKGSINWIDNGILGDIRDPMTNPTDKDKNVMLEVRCDPRKLDLGNAEEKTGVYIGYITFKSEYALISPLRLKITFIYFRNPIEGGLRGRNFGVLLTLRNSRGTVGDSCKLIFGTGHRATNAVDSLFGEFAYSVPLLDGIFNARFFPLDTNVKQLVPYGFGDWAPNDELTRTVVKDKTNNPLNGSRDIRDVNDTTASILYYCRFNPDGAQNYPITIEWDTTDFVPGSQMFLRDSVNGSHFNVNMRRATPIGPSRFSYVISDPRWTSFIIEYTLPRVYKYVDQFGKPIIKPGWNLLSLAVRPTDNFWNVFFPNAINVPFIFSQNQYQQQEFLKPGVGYFIKYPEEVQDKQFTGTYITRIAKDATGAGDVVRLYNGWNTIGALTFPMNVRDIQLDRYDNNNIPDLAETIKKGIYGYQTNRGYVDVSELSPGLGYWLYVNKGAYLKLIHPGFLKSTNVAPSEKEIILEQSSRITLRDNAQNEGNVYMTNDKEVDLSYFNLPPTPPYDLFDVRFQNGSYLENGNISVISLQGVSYPVSISMANADANYTFMDAATGEVYGTIPNGSTSNVTITYSKSNAVKVLKSDAVSGIDLANYPNPVETVSTLKYFVPDNGFVSVKLYDAMGREVSTLFEGFKNAGSYSDLKIDATGLAAGSYICKLSVGSQQVIKSITVVK